jgi:hypothetical protein
MQQAMPTQRRLDRKTKLALIVFIVALVGSIAAVATWSAFSETTGNETNQFETGSLNLTDNDSGTALFNMSGAVGGDTVEKCITVSYSGTLTSNVRLYGATTGGNGLNAYLDLQVTRGSFSGATPAGNACTNGAGSSFVADSVTYSGGNGAGSGGVLFNARMNNYPTTWSAGIVDAPGGTPEPWTASETHVYRLRVTVANDSDAAGKNHTQTFTWEAQNV